MVMMVMMIVEKRWYSNKLGREEARDTMIDSRTKNNKKPRWKEGGVVKKDTKT
jgi:hypothetical protein